MNTLILLVTILHINILWIYNIQLTIFSNKPLEIPYTKESGYKATEIKKEIRYLRQLEALGIKTPRRYKGNVVESFVGKALVVFENILLKFL
jgi:hypothetical protein